MENFITLLATITSVGIVIIYIEVKRGHNKTNEDIDLGVFVIFIIALFSGMLLPFTIVLSRIIENFYQ